MSEWISVEERLPEQDEPVLMYRAYHEEMLTGYYDYRWEEFFTVDEHIVGGITHWMPLPEPPVAVAENAMTTATGSETESVRCVDCKHRMFSDFYGECSAGHRGIVRPDDTCPHGDRRADDG